jgi:hypothetical protein
VQPPQKPFVIDTMIFDKIADDPGAAALVRRLVRHRAIELLVTHIQTDQIQAIPDQGRRKHLLNRVPFRMVPTHGAIYGVSKYGMATYAAGAIERDVDEITRRNDVQDALIRVTAK